MPAFIFFVAENATPFTWAVCPWRIARSWPLTTVPQAYRFVETSRGQHTAVGGKHQTKLEMKSSCPLSVKLCCPIVTSQKLCSRTLLPQPTNAAGKPPIDKGLSLGHAGLVG